MTDDFDAAARNLVAGYARNLDSRNLEGLVALFAPDGVVVTSGQEKVGQDGVRAWYAHVFETYPSGGLHLIANTILTREGPDAGSAASDELFFRKNEAGFWASNARYLYLDRFIRIDGEWRIVRHEMQPIG